MREAYFLKKNAEKWKAYEALLMEKKINPDQLADLFITLTDDLSFAKTNYPNSKITLYLNGLTAKVHQSIYQNKKEKGSRIISFWTKELPLAFIAAQKHFIYAFFIMFIAFLIGFFSTAFNVDFVRMILGDAYVNMTIENIENNDPMKVYKMDNHILMFLYIMFNNIMVSFRAFAMGIFISLGTGYILLFNGIMLGTFLYFFLEREVFSIALQTIWIHGTLEISAIIIAGGAGILLGNSILFPKTYTRLASFKKAASHGIKIIIGLIPIFILAAFLETFVTRLTEMPVILKLLIIFSSLSFVIFYYFLYPNILARRSKGKAIDYSSSSISS